MSVPNFKEELCQRIIDICNYSRTPEKKTPEKKTPEKEMNIQLALSLPVQSTSNELINSCYKQTETQAIQKTHAQLLNNGTPFLKAEVEIRAAKCQYIQTTINRKEISSEQSFKDSPLFSTNLKVKGWPPAFDIVYDKKDLLEIKYPRNKHRWNFSQWGSPEHTSTCPFKTPFLNIDNNNYIMGMEQEGQMFVDFMRLLKAKEVGLGDSKEIDNLYFAAFFKRSEFPKGASEDKAKKQFEERFRDLLGHYLKNDCKYIITEGKNSSKDTTQYIHLWDAEKPGGIKFFFNEKSGFEDGICTSQKPLFKCLHWGDSMVAFLLKLEPRLKGKVKMVL